MSKVNADAIKPRDTGLDITLGATGDTTVISADSIDVNTVKDSGGNTLWTSDGTGTLSNVNSALKGNFVLLDTNTTTAGASSAFTTLIDSTYDVYIFKIIEANPETNGTEFRVNFSIDGGSNYNVTKTTTYFRAKHTETGTDGVLEYDSSYDLAQSTAAQPLTKNIGSGADESLSGELYLFAPSSTTYVKHFYSTINTYHGSDYSHNEFVSGYNNTTSAINAVHFLTAAGNFDAIIKMYGLSST